jgi:hypothetical protein
MADDTPGGTAISDLELVLKFESLGDSCELGLVQRKVGAEPLGMFRFAGAPLRHLIRALEARFEGMADPQHVRVQPENGEYMIKLTKYDFIYHTDVKVGEADPKILHHQHVRSVRFLVDKLIGDLQDPQKIMVFRQNEELSANDLLDFRRVLSSYGSAMLLWVQPARPGFAPGQVMVVDDRLMIGYVTRLAPRQNAHGFDLRCWLTILRNAYAAHPVHAPRRTDTVFGVGGNATEGLGRGWSAPENGFTWSIEDRSILTIDHPGLAETYFIEMDVVPFVAPPAVPAQAMGITVSGELIHTFDPVPRGTIRCRVPNRLLDGRKRIEIVLEHPNAAIPRVATGQDDSRRLAVSFSRLSLIGS